MSIRHRTGVHPGSLTVAPPAGSGQGEVMSETFLGTIVTLGGGGFGMSSTGASALDDHLLDLSGAERPSVCFIPTASGDDQGYAEWFEKCFAQKARTSVFSLFCKPKYTDPAHLLEQDVIYVGGGSTANLLAVWRLHGLPEILRQAAAQGTVLAGISAGMNCWFDASSTDSYGDLAPLADGLGFLSGSACPHYLGEERRREQYLRWVAQGTLPPGVAVDDHVAVVWRDGTAAEAVCELPGKQAVQVHRDGTVAVEEPMPTRLLPGC